MNKIIVFGKENGKVWFGRPTTWSWIKATFFRGRMLKVVPIKGYEEYAYYPDHLYISFEFCYITNTEIGKTPLDRVAYACHTIANLPNEFCGKA